MPTISPSHRRSLIGQELTKLEKRVLESLCMGKIQKEIAYEIPCFTRRNIYYQAERIKIKLGAKTIEQAIAMYTLKNPELVKELIERIK